MLTPPVKLLPELASVTRPDPWRFSDPPLIGPVKLTLLAPTFTAPTSVIGPDSSPPVPKLYIDTSNAPYGLWPVPLSVSASPRFAPFCSERVSVAPALTMVPFAGEPSSTPSVLYAPTDNVPALTVVVPV